MFRPTPNVAAAALAAATMIAACGSSSSTSPRSNGHPTQAQTQAVVAFAGCMRSHGVPTFPDPRTSPVQFKNALDAKSPAFHSAAAACQHLLPPGRSSGESPAHSRAQIAAMLAFARCVRSHGFPNFPDPTPSGEETHEMLAHAGINLHQPAVLQAGDACVSVTHGIITRADVARAAAGQ